MIVPRMPRWIILAILLLVVLARSAVFVLWPAAHFDSDQAVTGLMAKHLAELRALPVFWYGQTYMLGVEAWLAAPLMALFGASVTALKLPLLAMNVAIALLLFRRLAQDEGLDDARAAFATLFFVLAAPITSAHFLTANGGNVEPCLYVLLLWTLRQRPIGFGLVLGVGFLNREFTIYGAAALMVLDLVRRTLFTRDAARRYALAFGTAALVWVAFLALRHFSSAAGPGTSTADLSANLAGNNLLQVAERLCFDLRAIAGGAWRVLTVHWPELFGLEPQPLTDFGIESTVRQGLTGSAWLLVPVFGIPIVRLGIVRLGRLHASRIARLRAGHTDRASAGPAPRPPSRPPDADRFGEASSPGGDFCAYLMLVAVFSLAGYLIGRCGVIDFYTMRYELLSVLGAVGLAGRYLRVERSRVIATVWALCGAALFAISITAHLRLLAEYATHPPVALKQDLIRELDARHVRYAYADFWTAYYVSFMTRERIIVAADDAVKVRTYNRLVDAHRAEAIRISRRACPGGEQLTAHFWSCTP
jgi:hypothetical protein